VFQYSNADHAVNQPQNSTGPVVYRLRPDSACTSHIEGRLKNLKTTSYENYWEFKNTIPVVPGRKGGGMRKEIKSFSRNSRRNYLKTFGRIPQDQAPTLWQDFTFADDVMKDKTLEQRAVSSTETLHRFRKRFKRRYPGSYLIWKREWKERKSGVLAGEYCPHYHALIGFAGTIDENTILPRHLAPTGEGPERVVLDLAEMWVDCTQTEQRSKALSVALHPQSYRLIRSLVHARRYAVAYTGKQDYELFKESVGRFWGAVGKLPQDPGEDLNISSHDEIWMRRIARRMTNKRKKKFKKQMSRLGTSTFFMMSRATLHRLLYWIRQGADLDKGQTLTAKEVIKNDA
jgi:hypothetical protein